jgi:GT2 family glycosyltransferase
MMSKNITEKIGIVIIGRNEAKRLPLCFQSMDMWGCEKVYVDSDSSDDSVAIAKEHGIEVVELDKRLPFSAARARNEGFKYLLELNAELEFVHFIDGDCELDKNWLLDAIDVLDKQETVAVVFGRLREKHRNTSVYMKLCDMGWYKPAGFVDACGGIATYRRTVFESMGGFNALLIAGEEPELCLRIRNTGWKVLSLDAEMGTHDSAMTQFTQWWTRCVKVGFGYMNGLEWGGWSKQYKSALFWAGLPFFIVLLVLITNSSAGLLLFLLYPVQIYRIFKKASTGKLSRKDRFIYAFFCMLSKFPESQGILNYFLNKISSKNKVIQYK